jgi:hypothetical protein
MGENNQNIITLEDGWNKQIKVEALDPLEVGARHRRDDVIGCSCVAILTVNCCEHTFVICRKCWRTD